MKFGRCRLFSVLVAGVVLVALVSGGVVGSARAAQAGCVKPPVGVGVPKGAERGVARPDDLGRLTGLPDSGVTPAPVDALAYTVKVDATPWSRRLNRGAFVPTLYTRCQRGGELPTIAGNVAPGDYSGVIGQAGWPIILRDPAGAVVTTSKTTGGGRYRIAGAPVGQGGAWTVSLITRSGERIVARVLVRVDPTLTDSHGYRDGLLSVRGRVSAPGMVTGKEVLLEWRDRAQARWRPAARTHTDATGGFTFGYRFARPEVATVVTMRVVVPTELGWPYAEINGKPWIPNPKATTSPAPQSA